LSEVVVAWLGQECFNGCKAVDPCEGLPYCTGDLRIPDVEGEGEELLRAGAFFDPLPASSLAVFMRSRIALRMFSSASGVCA